MIEQAAIEGPVALEFIVLKIENPRSVTVIIAWFYAVEHGFVPLQRFLSQVRRVRYAFDIKPLHPSSLGKN